MATTPSRGRAPASKTAIPQLPWDQVRPAPIVLVSGTETVLADRAIRLLRDILDVADRNGEAAYLEATSDLNRRLYERHGFRWVADLPMPDGPTAYAMWRDPGAG